MYKNYEDELQLLIDKVEGNSEDDWEDLVDKLDVRMHPDSLRKSFNVGRYSGYQVAKYFQDKFMNEYCTEEEVEKLESLKNEVYKEKVKLRDVKREYLKHLRHEARFENLLDTVKYEVANLEPIKLYKCNENTNTGVNGALIISDLHYGSTSDNVLNLYNTDVCKDRMNQLLNKTIYYCSIHRVQTLYINLLGDLVNGNIHTSVRCEQEEDVISQIIHVAELLSQFISELSNYVPEIKIVCVQGNHSRVTPNLKESLNVENFERMIFEIIKTRLPDIPMIINGLEDWATYEIGDRKIFVEHGDKTKIDSIKNKAINLLGYVPTDIFVGHYHHMENISDGNTDVVINGSVMGVDSYAMKHRLNNKPHQVLRVYNDEDVCTYKIVLD